MILLYIVEIRIINIPLLGNGKTLSLFDSLWIDYKFEFFIIVR